MSSSYVLPRLRIDRMRSGKVVWRLRSYRPSVYTGSNTFTENLVTNRRTNGPTESEFWPALWMFVWWLDKNIFIFHPHPCLTLINSLHPHHFFCSTPKQPIHHYPYRGLLRKSPVNLTSHFLNRNLSPITGFKRNPIQTSTHFCEMPSAFSLSYQYPVDSILKKANPI